MQIQIDYLKEEYAEKPLDELRQIFKDVESSYSIEARFAAMELLQERGAEVETIDRLMLLQEKNDQVLGAIRWRVGCLCAFMLFLLTLMFISLVSAFATLAGLG